MEKLCRVYWYPLYVFVRRQGHDKHTAKDLTQGFFAKLLEKNYLADVRREKGKFRNFMLKSIKHFTSDEGDKARALAMRKKLLGNEHPDMAGSLNNLAGILIQENKLQEAETAQREALAIQRKLLPAEHEDIAGSLVNLASVLWCQGRSSEAEAAFREALGMQRKLLGAAHPDIAMTLQNLASVLQSETNFTGAETLFRESLATRKTLLLSGYAGMKEHEALIPIPNKSRLAEAIQSIARLYEATGRPDPAAEWKKRSGP